MQTNIAIVSTQLNGFNYWYLKLIIHSISIICLQTVKWLQVLLFNTNYSIEHWLNGRVFANSLGDQGSVPGRVIPKTPKKMVLDATLLNNQHYKVWIKNKVEQQSREWSNALPLHLGVVAIEKDPWCNGHRRRKWTWRHKFKPWTRLIAFHITLIPWERYESNYSPSSYG